MRVQKWDFPLSLTAHTNSKNTAAIVPLNLSFKEVELFRRDCPPGQGLCAQYIDDAVSRLKRDVHVLCKAPLSLVVFATLSKCLAPVGELYLLNTTNT